MIKKVKKFYSDIKRINLFSEFVIDLKCFSFRVAFFRFCSNLPVFRAKAPNISKYFYKNLQCSIKAYLFKRCGYVINEFNKKNIIIDKEIVCTVKNIWVFWWQGEEDLPLLVKNCITSIRKNSGADNVHVLSKDNYNNFVQIPDYILEKFEKGQLDITKLSNILRLTLLFQHGGLWLDATVFCSRKIPNEIFNYPFFSCRNTKKISYNSDSFTWGTYILGSPKASPIIKLILDCQLAYWKKEILSIEYTFFDVIHELIYENTPIVKEQLDNLPCNNEQVLDMLIEMKLNMSFSKERLNVLLHSDTFLYKLSWKFKFREVSEDSQKTLYYNYLYHYDEFFGSYE